MIFELCILLFVTWLLRMHLSQRKKDINLPGPWRVPIIGQLLNIEKKFYSFHSKLLDKFGTLLHYNILNESFVLIGDVKTLKELYSLEQVSGRTVFDFFCLYEGEPMGISPNSGKKWEVLRRFTLRQLRDFGFGKNSMESMILEEVHEFNDNLKKRNGSPVGGVKQLFSLAVLNSLWNIVSGERFKHDDPKLHVLTKNLARIFTASAESGGIVFVMPFLKYLMPKYTGYTETRKGFEGLKAFVKNAVEEHKKTYQPDSCRDFIDVFLQEIESEKDLKSTFYGIEAERQLIAVTADLFLAGNDTTSTELSWAMLYLSLFPEVQKKLHKEIVSITGGTRDLLLSDRPSASYLLATLEEVMRHSNMIPLASHKVTTDFTHKGVHYKKGTTVDVSVYYIHSNPKTWGDPDNFRPERFLTGEGNTFQKNENMVAFLVGKRQCIGETLARDSLFLFLGNVVQNFEILTDTSKPTPTLEPALGFLLAPQEYSVIFKARN